MSTADITYMKRALALARKGLGKTSPNPAVGCVIVQHGVIVGEGWHRKAGTPHAEVHALNMAGDAARGSDVYVTLEPCSHTGRTPPCCDALIRAGVSRVVAGMGDPNPLVNGTGLAALRRAGIATDCGVLEAECRAINRPFISVMTKGRPYVTHKCAMTLDGRIATAHGDSRWITSEASRRIVHRMRADRDAVLVGIGTLIADDPQLTVRHVAGRSPLRIVVDSRLRTPVEANVLNPSLAAGTIIVTLESAPERHAPYLSKGARIVVCAAREGKVDLADLWRQLAGLGIQSILLEGGGELAGVALRQGLIDESVLFYGPKVIGGDGLPAFAFTGLTAMADAVSFTLDAVKRVGSDIMVTARPECACLLD